MGILLGQLQRLLAGGSDGGGAGIESDVNALGICAPTRATGVAVVPFWWRALNLNTVADTSRLSPQVLLHPVINPTCVRPEIAGTDIALKDVGPKGSCERRRKAMELPEKQRTNSQDRKSVV